MPPALSALPVARFLGGIAWRLLLLLAAYGLFIQVVRPVPYLQNIFDLTWRRVAAEQLACHQPEPTGVIVGSSYSRMFAFDLPSDFIDGGFFGGGCLTGNEILLRSHARPKIVLIEVNRIDRPLDGDLVREVTAEPMSTIRRLCPAFRFEYRPIRLLQAQCRKWGRALGQKFGRSREKPELPGGTTADREAASLPKAPHTAEPPLDEAGKAEALANFDTLERQVAAFRQRGIQVAFLHLPFDPWFEAQPARHFVNATAEERFPKSRYAWIDLPSDGSFQTYDGTHVIPGPESLRVSDIVVARARKLIAESGEAAVTR